jgi:hypothetical protein
LPGKPPHEKGIPAAAIELKRWAWENGFTLKDLAKEWSVDLNLLYNFTSGKLQRIPQSYAFAERLYEIGIRIDGSAARSMGGYAQMYFKEHLRGHYAGLMFRSEPGKLDEVVAFRMGLTWSRSQSVGLFRETAKPAPYRLHTGNVAVRQRDKMVYLLSSSPNGSGHRLVTLTHDETEKCLHGFLVSSSRVGRNFHPFMSPILLQKVTDERPALCASRIYEKSDPEYADLVERIRSLTGLQASAMAL